MKKARQLRFKASMWKQTERDLNENLGKQDLHSSAFQWIFHTATTRVQYVLSFPQKSEKENRTHQTEKRRHRYTCDTKIKLRYQALDYFPDRKFTVHSVKWIRIICNIIILYKYLLQSFFSPQIRNVIHNIKGCRLIWEKVDRIAVSFW